MFDQAFDIAKDRKDAQIARKAWLKIDFHVTLMLCGVYFLQFLDKSLLNYSAVMGIKQYLKPKTNEFSNLGTILFIAYIVGEPINVYLFQKVPPAKLMAACVFCWGAVVIGHAFAKDYSSLMAVRFFLGLFESAVAPGCTLITGMWYNQAQQLRRTCWWTCQAGFATIIGGLLSFAFQHVHNKTFQGWQMFCLIMGIVTVLWSVLMLFLMPDSPILAKFLTEDEKAAVIENIRDNQTGTASREFKMSHLKELLLHDKLTWLMLILTLLLMIPTGAVLTFSVTMIANIGFSTKNAALMQMPLGVSTIWAISMGTYLCAYFKGKHRNLIFISMLIPAIIGYIVLITSTNKVGQLLAVYLINVGTCVITMIYSWNSANTAGYTKRVARTCLTMIFFSAGALIGPQLFRVGDSPRYIRAKTTLLAITVACVPLMLLISYVSHLENKKRDALEESFKEKWIEEKGDNYEFMDLTDKENIMFRYSY